MSEHNYSELANSWALWCEYVDPSATWTEDEFNAATEDELIQHCIDCFGRDESLSEEVDDIVGEMSEYDKYQFVLSHKKMGSGYVADAVFDAITTHVQRTRISPDDVSAIDMRERIESEQKDGVSCECWKLQIVDDDGYVKSAPNGTLVWWPQTEVAACEWGSDSVWIESDSEEDVMAAFLLRD